MNTESITIRPGNYDDQALGEANTAAVLDLVLSGKPLDPAILERVRARAGQITEKIRRDRGLVDDDTFQLLLDDEA